MILKKVINYSLSNVLNFVEYKRIVFIILNELSISLKWTLVLGNNSKQKKPE